MGLVVMSEIFKIKKLSTNLAFLKFNDHEVGGYNF